MSNSRLGVASSNLPGAFNLAQLKCHRIRGRFFHLLSGPDTLHERPQSGVTGTAEFDESRFAIRRLSPRSGPRSAIVPRAARAVWNGGCSVPSSSNMARPSMNATPAPVSPVAGVSDRPGLTMATAAGRVPGTTWWSVIIVSIPACEAASTSWSASMPVSTVTTRLAPASLKYLTALFDRPCPSFSRCGYTAVPVRQGG